MFGWAVNRRAVRAHAGLEGTLSFISIASNSRSLVGGNSCDSHVHFLFSRDDLKYVIHLFVMVWVGYIKASA